MKSDYSHGGQPYTPRGTQPVRVLEQNILYWFERKYPEFRSELEQLGVTSIKYYCDEMPISNPNGYKQTPHVTDNGQICLHETFLSYLWALSYSIIVIFDEGLNGPKTGKLPSHGKPVGHFLQYGDDVLKYGVSLVKDYKPWPTDLPNPDLKWYKGEDSHFPTKANGIYVAAVDFILCHEVAHVACGHLKKMAEAKLKGEYLPKYEIKEGEIEADAWALERVIRGIRDPKRPKTTVYFGAIAGLASILFLGTELTSSTHPDTDNRIRTVLERLGGEKIDSLWGIAAAYYMAWSNCYKIGIDWQDEFDTYSDFVDEIERQLLDRKDSEEMRRLGFD